MQMSHDPFNLQRFISVQQAVYPAVLDELRDGKKRTHWMWFIFPQVDGLGHSSTAKHYAIGSHEEGIAYLAHPVLGGRLRECAGLVLDVTSKSAHQIFGSPDDKKFHSSMTLFGFLDRDRIFGQAINRFYDGHPDETTLKIMSDWKP